MTKVIILGQEPKEEKKLKPIEFVKLFTEDCEIIEPYAICKPKYFDHIELICRNYVDNSLDLMFAYRNKYGRNQGTLIFGHFNDGVTE